MSILDEAEAIAIRGQDRVDYLTNLVKTLTMSHYRRESLLAKLKRVYLNRQCFAELDLIEQEIRRK